MIDKHIPIHNTSEEIELDWKLMRLVSAIFGRKIFCLSLNVPQLFDVFVVEECLLYNFLSIFIQISVFFTEAVFE